MPNPNDFVPIPFPGKPPNLPSVDLTVAVAKVIGESDSIEGVRGVSHGPHGGVVGINDWKGDGSPGSGGNGGWFQSSQGEGVRGWSDNPNHGGVVGVNTRGGVAVYGITTRPEANSKTRTSVNTPGGVAVYGMNDSGGIAVYGTSKDSVGVWGTSTNSEGVHAETNSPEVSSDRCLQL